MTDVNVDRGWFKSNATAQLQIVGRGGSPLVIPLNFRTSQGFAPDGSTMHVMVHIGSPDNSAIAAVLGAVHDPNPITANIAFNFTGDPTHVSLKMAPMTASIPSKLGAPIQFQWGGGRSDMTVGGFYSPQGGSVQETITLLPWLIRMPQRALNVFMGRITGSFNGSGKPGDFGGDTNIVVRESGVTHAGTGNDVIIKQITFQSYFSSRQPAAVAGNLARPLGGRFSYTNLNLTAQMIKPAGGSILVTGNASVVIPPQPAVTQTPGDIQELRKSILKNMQVHLHLRIDRALLTQIPPQQLDRLEKSGDLRVDGSNDVIDFVIKNGVTSINGKQVSPKPQAMTSVPPTSGPGMSSSSLSLATSALGPTAGYASNYQDLRSAVSAPVTSIGVPLRPEMIVAPGLARISHSLEVNGQIRIHEYQRLIGHILAMRIRALRVTQERNLFAQTGHAVPLPTGLCTTWIDIAPSGVVQNMLISSCDNQALAGIERRAIASQPFPPLGIPTHIRVTINAPLATPGVAP